MRFTFSLAAAAALCLSALSGVSADTGPLGVVSYPRECGRLCGPVVTESQGTCLNDDLMCICSQKNMKKLVPECASCAYNQRNSKLGPDFLPAIKKLENKCGFKKTSVTVGFAAPTAAPLGLGALAGVAAFAAM